MVRRLTCSNPAVERLMPQSELRRLRKLNTSAVTWNDSPLRVGTTLASRMSRNLLQGFRQEPRFMIAPRWSRRHGSLTMKALSRSNSAWPVLPAGAGSGVSLMSLRPKNRAFGVLPSPFASLGETYGYGG